jgi:murein DD-endopeptidase MepM/ murein hydrolase activator NlpD
VAGDWLDDETLVFTARNLTAFPLTVTVRVQSTMTGSEAQGKTMQTVAPQSETELLRYERAPTKEPKPRFKFNYDWGFGVAHVRHDDDYLYRFPYASGKHYGVLQGYGSSFSHTGNEYYSVDFNMARGTPVHAARDGIVMDLTEHHGEGCWEKRCKRTANFVKILHDDGSTGEYYHLLRDGVLVSLGERVERGQKIALSGNSGHSTMPHLHFGVYEAIEWGRTKSIPVRFDSEAGVVETPRRRGRYVARD